MGSNGESSWGICTPPSLTGLGSAVQALGNHSGEAAHFTSTTNLHRDGRPWGAILGILKCSSVAGHRRSERSLKPCWRSCGPQFYEFPSKYSLGPRVQSQGSCATSSMTVLCPIFNKWSPQSLPCQGPYNLNFHDCVPLSSMAGLCMS